MAAALFFVKWGGCEVHYYFKLLIIPKKHLKEFDQINPIGFCPYWLYFSFGSQSIIEVKAVYIYCYFFHIKKESYH